ncbi:hypothetical protein NT01EI_2049 [Edwardsiella ictaluri 93-146]|uniref:Uncharacterized protein n=1 Tax=Edwardsiella ictaluri (strain 93-146) TaxID=634503 RepID=C5BBQ4_EDWI9|nr:hypothetical protein NT01EI_2049 [Edwardsiella ictaluri 93-146]
MGIKSALDHKVAEGCAPGRVIALNSGAIEPVQFCVIT